MNKKRNNSFSENPQFENYQKQLLAYSLSKLTHPKINPDYFALAQQVCKNQNLMHSHKNIHTVSAADTPRRSSRESMNDIVDTYKQTVKKLVNDRKILNKEKNKLNSYANI